MERAVSEPEPDTEQDSISVMSSEREPERDTTESEPEPVTDAAPDGREEPAAEDDTAEPVSTEDAPAERDGSAADAETESLLGDIVGATAATAAKPLNSLTDVARQLARRDHADDPDTGSGTPETPADDTPDDSGAEPEPEPEPEPASEGPDAPDAPDDDPAASATEQSDESESRWSGLGEVGELVHIVTPNLEEGQDEQTESLVGDVVSTLTPVLAAVTAPVNDVVESSTAPARSVVTEPAGTAVGTVVDPVGAVLAGVVDVTPLTGVINQAGELLPAVTDPVRDAVDPVGALLAPAMTAVAPLVEVVEATAAPLLELATETVGALDPILAPVPPLLAPVIEALEPITGELVPTTPPPDVPDPVVESPSGPSADAGPDPVRVDPEFSPAGNNTAWGPAALDSVGAASLPATAGEPLAATPASLTGVEPAGTDVSSNIIITTTIAGGALADSGHGAPPAVASVSGGQGSGGDRSFGPWCDMHAVAVPLIGSMFLRRERSGVAALAESPRQPGVLPD